MISPVRVALAVCLFAACLPGSLRTAAAEEQRADTEVWTVAPDFAELRPTVIAVLPMDNLSLEAGLEATLIREVQTRLPARGYQIIAADKVAAVMTGLGVLTPGQIAGIAPQRLGTELNADAILQGQIEQSAAVHAGVYDAVVVSASLRLTSCRDGKILWQTDQWRAAHRQWQIDPVNIVINAVSHEKASRHDRVAYLVDQMLKTLPPGPITVEIGNLLDSATEVIIDASDK